MTSAETMPRAWKDCPTCEGRGEVIISNNLPIFCPTCRAHWLGEGEVNQAKRAAEKILRDYIEGQVDATIQEYACSDRQIKAISQQGDEILAALEVLTDKKQGGDK